MTLRSCTLTGLLVCCLAIGAFPGTAYAAETLRRGADTLSDISDALREADAARERYDRFKSSQDAQRYEREWRDREYGLEESRVNRMAREAKVPADRIRTMREEGVSWQDIGRRYKVDPQNVGYGHKGPGGYDRDNDRDLNKRMYKDNPGKARGHYKGTADGPPGQYNKSKGNKADKRGGNDRYDRRERDRDPDAGDRPDRTDRSDRTDKPGKKQGKNRDRDDDSSTTPKGKGKKGGKGRN